MYKVLLDYDPELKYIQLPDGSQHYTTANLAEFKHENNQVVEKLVKLKNAGFSTDDIIELKRKELI